MDIWGVKNKRVSELSHALSNPLGNTDPWAASAGRRIQYYKDREKTPFVHRGRHCLLRNHR